MRDLLHSAALGGSVPNRATLVALANLLDEVRVLNKSIEAWLAGK